MTDPTPDVAEEIVELASRLAPKLDRPWPSAERFQELGFGFLTAKYLHACNPTKIRTALAAEREACAKQLDEFAEDCEKRSHDGPGHYRERERHRKEILHDAAQAIRTREGD